jgi:hypothetical protein
MAQANNTPNDLLGPPTDNHCGATRRAPREAGAVSCRLRLERYRARRAAIAAAASEEDSDEDSEEEQEEYLRFGIHDERPQTEAEDITGPSKQLSPPVQRARKILMVSTVHNNNRGSTLTGC